MKYSIFMTKLVCIDALMDSYNKEDITVECNKLKGTEIPVLEFKDKGGNIIDAIILRR